MKVGLVLAMSAVLKALMAWDVKYCGVLYCGI